MNKNKIIKFKSILMSYFIFFLKKKEKKEIIFFNEGISHNQFYLDFINKIKDKKDVIIITNQFNNYLKLKKNYQILYFGNKLILKFVLDNINCKYFFTTTTDLGENFKKSKKCDEYIYIFHSLASCNKIYKKNAFNNYDVICANGEYQINELKKMELLYNLDKKKYLNTGYSFFNHLFAKEITPKKNKLKKILIAPSWNLRGDSFFDLYCEKLIKIFIDNNYQIILRPHPENIKRSKKIFEKLHNLSIINDFLSIDTNSDNFESMNETDLLITDYSTISLEYIYGFKKPVIFINSKEKVHNTEYDKVSTLNFEDSVRNMCRNIDLNELENIIYFSENEFRYNNLEKIINKIKDNLFKHTKFNEIVKNHIGI